MVKIMKARKKHIKLQTARIYRMIDVKLVNITREFLKQRSAMEIVKKKKNSFMRSRATTDVK